jgi:ribonuclease-3 family protein
MENNIFRDMNTKLTAEDIVMLSPLQLAYVGDAVYELLVRTYLLKKGLSVKELHKATIKFVKAKSQANIVHNLEEELTEHEKTVVKKGRNAKSNTVPKNADLIDYKYATGFEALIGELYLGGKDERLSELFLQILDMDIN